MQILLKKYYKKVLICDLYFKPKNPYPFFKVGDVNASINIKNFALKNILSGTDRKNRNELSAMVEVMTSEAHSPLG